MLENINPINDTLRFFLYIAPPFLMFLFYIRFNFREKFIKIKNLFEFEDARHVNINLKDILLFKILLFLFISFEFINLDFANYIYLDTLHDGDFLTPLKNYQNYNGLWSSSFVIHGGRDIFIPIISSKIFGNFNIAPIKFLYIFLIYLIKFLSIILAFQISKSQIYQLVLKK